MQNKQIFISHSSKDDKIASEICAILENNGLTCCMDHRDFRSGKDFDQEILDGIENGSAFVLLLSGSSNESHQVKREVQLAADKGRGTGIFPVRIENVEPSRNLKFFLSLKHWTDAFEEPLESYLTDLIKNLQEFLNVGKPIKDSLYVHYEKAMQYRKSDPEVSIQYVDKAIDGICRKIYSDLGLSAGNQSDNPRIDEIVKLISESKMVPGHILIPIGIMRTFSSYTSQGEAEGTKFFTEDYIAPSLDALTTVIKWYYNDFKKLTPTKSDADYDVVLSYSSIDEEWVTNNIFRTLSNGKTLNNAKPKILPIISDITVSNENQLFRESITAVNSSKRVVFILSSSFFKSNFQKSLLARSVQLDPEGKKGLIVPILHTDFRENDIPIGYSDITPVDFEKSKRESILVEKIGIIPSKSQQLLTLEFESTIRNYQLNETLENIRVLLSNRSDKEFGECEVEISASKPGIQGDLKKKTKDGIAVFDALSFLSEGTQIVLKASSNGYKEAISNAFNVTGQSEVQHKNLSAPSEIQLTDHCFELFLYNKGRNLAIIYSDGFSLHDMQNNSLRQPIRFKKRIRLTDIHTDSMIIADWSGKTCLVKADLSCLTMALPENEFIYQIPSNSVMYNNVYYLGFWNGYIYKLSDNAVAEVILRHQAGIQFFVMSGNSCIFCDMNGELYHFQNNMPAKIAQLEFNILGMKAIADNTVVIIGRDRIYHYSPLTNTIINEKSGLDYHDSVFFHKDFFAIMDHKGKGSILDFELVKLATLSSVEGSKILYLDENKEYSILQYPNNTRVIMKSNRVIYSHSNGPIILDADHKKVVTCTINKLNVFDLTNIDRISQS